MSINARGLIVKQANDRAVAPTVGEGVNVRDNALPDGRATAPLYNGRKKAARDRSQSGFPVNCWD